MKDNKSNQVLNQVQEITIESLFFSIRMNPEGFFIPFSRVWEIMGFTRKFTAKRSILSILEEGVEYIVKYENAICDSNKELVHTNVHHAELLNIQDCNNNDTDEANSEEVKHERFIEDTTDYLMTSVGFKSWCMSIRTPVAKAIKNYYIKIEEAYWRDQEDKTKRLYNSKARLEDSLSCIEIYKKLGEIFKCPEIVALQEGSKFVKKNYDLDFLSLTNQSKDSDNIALDEMYYQPKELGMIYNISAIKVNKVLFELGYQVKNKEKAQWEVTDKTKNLKNSQGNAVFYIHAWIVQNHEGYNLKWTHDFFDTVYKEWLVIETREKESKSNAKLEKKAAKKKLKESTKFLRMQHQAEFKEHIAN